MPAETRFPASLSVVWNRQLYDSSESFFRSGGLEPMGANWPLEGTCRIGIVAVPGWFATTWGLPARRMPVTPASGPGERPY